MIEEGEIIEENKITNEPENQVIDLENVIFSSYGCHATELSEINIPEENCLKPSDLCKKCRGALYPNNICDQMMQTDDNHYLEINRSQSDIIDITLSIPKFSLPSSNIVDLSFFSPQPFPPTIMETPPCLIVTAPQPPPIMETPPCLIVSTPQPPPIMETPSCCIISAPPRPIIYSTTNQFNENLSLSALPTQLSFNPNHFSNYFDIENNTQAIPAKYPKRHSPSRGDIHNPDYSFIPC